MKIINDGLPDITYQAMLNDPYSGPRIDDPSKISVTSMIKPAYMRRLEREHWDELVVPASTLMWVLDGQLKHGILERAAGEGMVVERRFEMLWGDISISGQVDVYDPATKILTDYKNTSVWAMVACERDGIKPDWEAQVNVLAGLVRHNGFSVDRLEIVARCRDWDWRKVEGNYPRKPEIIFHIPLWNDNKITDYIDGRVAEHTSANPLPCTPAERWYRDEKWAVMKQGRKSAVRVLDTETDANALAYKLGQGHSVVCRPGRNVRCEGYCVLNNHGNKFCPAMKGNAR